MSLVLVVLIVAFVAGVALGLYAWLAPRAVPVKRDLAAPKPPPVPAPERRAFDKTTDWTQEAGAEFAGLSESARCDLVFAVADLQDERSQQLLLHALGDPSEAVVLAAAHVLARRGQSGIVHQYAEEHPGERAERIVQTLALME